MVAVQHFIHFLACDIVRVFFTRSNARQHLTANTVNRILIKARVLQGLLQQSHRRVLVFGQKTRGYGQAVVIYAEPETGCQPFGLAGKATRIQLTGTFFQQSGHQIDGAPLTRSIQRSPASESDVQGDKGDGVFLHQPCFQPTGGRNFLDLDFGLCRKGGQQRQRDNVDQSHSGTSSRISQPVTDASRLNTSLAACMISSAVTASRTSGQSCTSCTVNPMASALP